MADIYTSKNDELLISRIINDGFNQNMHKYHILRLALARSLQIDSIENLEFFDNFKKGDGGKEYVLKQLTGHNSQDEDYDKYVRLILGYKHNLNLFDNDFEYKKVLQRHIRRGLQEIETSWKSTHSIYEWITQDMMNDISIETNNKSNDIDILLALDKCGIKALLTDTIDASRLIHYTIKLNTPNDIKPFENIIHKQLPIMLGTDSLTYANVQGESLTYNITIAKDESKWKNFDYFNIKKWILEIPKNMTLGVFLGVDEFDKPYYFDLISAPHLFLAGTTGSGKSVTLHMIITSLMQKSINDIEFIFIDPKKVELAIYNDSSKLSNLSNKQVITENEDMESALENIVEEMERRYNILEKKGVQNISDLAIGELKHIIIVVEELADILMSSNVKFNKNCERLLGRLAQKSRAAGIHLVLVTQRPSSEVLPGTLRSNIPSRIALKVQKSSESKIILDEIGAEKLVGKGDCLVKILPNTNTKRIHSVFLRSENIKDLIN